MKKKVCPFNPTYFCDDGCAVYSNDSKCCSFLQIATSLTKIESFLVRSEIGKAIQKTEKIKK